MGKLKSQEMRKVAPELDPLRIGTGWKPEDLEKPQVLIESTYGDSHPGSGHLNLLVEEVKKGIEEAGGFGARYFCTDICDGESQGTDGINFSLVSREMISNMIEIHANATPFDGGVYLSSCDKGLPGNLMGLCRVNIPAIVVPGGTMNAGPDMLTLEQLGMYSAKYQRGEIDEEKLNWAKQNACPSCGACSFIGTASTDYGGSSWAGAAGQRIDACHQSGFADFRKRSRKAICKTGMDGPYASQRSVDDGQF